MTATPVLPMFEPRLEVEEAAPFWEGVAAHEIRLSRCSECHRWEWYPDLAGPNSAGAGYEWVTVASTGVLHTFSRVHRQFLPGPAGPLPFVVGLVHLDGVVGPRLVVPIADGPGLAVGVRVAAQFVTVDGRARVVFVPDPLEEVPMTETATITDLRRQFARDGVIHLPGVLDAEWMELIALGIQRNVNTPGPYAKRLYPGTEREYYLDYLNYRVIPEWQVLLRESPLCATVAEVMDSEELWLFFEQIWLKEGGATRRTAWHQDATTWLTGGTQVCGAWITLDPLEAEHSLEFVRGSHLGTIFGGTQLDGTPYDDTMPVYPDMPRLPDIQSHREDFDIVSFPNTPGDIVIFHPATLHGGGAGPGRRRTLSVRFFGDDVTYSPRPGRPSPPFPGVPATHVAGQPLRSAWFPKVHPVHE